MPFELQSPKLLNPGMPMMLPLQKHNVSFSNSVPAEAITLSLTNRSSLYRQTLFLPLPFMHLTNSTINVPMDIDTLVASLDPVQMRQTGSIHKSPSGLTVSQQLFHVSPAKRYPQTACAGLAQSLQAEWQYFQQVTPHLDQAFAPLETAIAQIFLPALLNSIVKEADQFRHLIALPVRHGGLGLLDPTR